MSEHSCKQCGRCCHFEIPITLLDIHRIAKHLVIGEKKAFEDYIQDKISPKSSLFMIKKDEKRACLFLTDENICSIHPIKPNVCRFFDCTLASAGEYMPWTATYTHPSQRSGLWEQAIAIKVTKAYIKNNSATWNSSDYKRAIKSIQENIASNKQQKIKLARDSQGFPMAMIYACAQCDKRGMRADETPVTLDDIRRITNKLKVKPKMFFQKKIASEPSTKTGCLKLIRHDHCIFFHLEKHCTIKNVRPMHCRFTPCPKRTTSDEMMTGFYLGSGTLQEQFRHQVAMSVTRRYVSESGVKYNKSMFENCLKQIDRFVSDAAGFERFCRDIAPYRYVDDTLMALKDNNGHI